MARRQDFIIAARIGGVLAIVSAPILFMAAKWYVNLMEGFPFPAQSPLKPQRPRTIW